MTTITTSSQASPASISAPAAARPGLARAEIAMLVMVGAAFIAVFWRLIWRQLGYEGFSWSETEDWGHSYIVPLISAYAVWKNREQIAAAKPEMFLPGLPLMLMGVAIYQYFVTGYSNHMFQGAAMLVSLAGLVLFLLGPRVFPMLLFPIAYLAFAVTISQMVMLKITFGLKLLASKGSWALLNLCSIDTDLFGNILHVHHNGVMTPLNVADACAGMRMVVAFVALAVAVAFLSCRHWWQRIAVLMLAVPVALAMNIVRVAVLGAATLIDADLSVGGAHTFIGTLLLIPAFIIFMSCVWALKQVEPDKDAATSVKKVKKVKGAAA